MIALPSNVRVWLACGHTDMRRGFDGLASQVQQQLGHDPFNGQFFVFRGKRGDLIKILSWDGQGLCLFAKRLEKGRFVSRLRKRVAALRPLPPMLIGAVPRLRTAVDALINEIQRDGAHDPDRDP